MRVVGLVLLILAADLLLAVAIIGWFIQATHRQPPKP